MNRYVLYLSTAILLMTGCTSETKKYSESTAPSIYPDFTEITVPSNIASPNFLIEDEPHSYVTVLE